LFVFAECGMSEVRRYVWAEREINKTTRCSEVAGSRSRLLM
jgi:hypothetical protein